MKRKLVTIQEIKELRPIENADRIEIAEVMGWKLIVKKGEFKVGDLGVYFEVDSFIPMDPKYEFLSKSSYRNNEYMGEGYRVKTMVMRGQISQGLMLPLDNYPELIGVSVGDDVTDKLGVIKWEMPEVMGNLGIEVGQKPFGIPTTNELRAQSNEELLNMMQGKDYYITTKIDGTSCTIYNKDGKVGVCGRNHEYKDTNDSNMWGYFHRKGLVEKISKLDRNLAFQGELAGPGIQGNRLKLREHEYYLFDIFDIDTRKYLNYFEMLELSSELGMQIAYVEEVGESFNYNLDELLEKARGKYISGIDKEGIVIRPKYPEYVVELCTKLSLKVINNDFLKNER